jgi:hypothetical protein
MRWRLQISKSLLKYTFEIFQHFVIPESQDSKSILFEDCGSMVVLRHAIGVLAAIELNDQSCFDTCEVNDVSGNRQLSPEFEFAQAPSAQMCPEHPFDIRRSDTQGACFGDTPSQFHASPHVHVHAPPSPAPAARPLPPAGEVIFSCYNR